MTYKNIDYVSFPPTKDDVYSHKYHYDKSVNNINKKKTIYFTSKIRLLNRKLDISNHLNRLSFKIKTLSRLSLQFVS